VSNEKSKIERATSYDGRLVYAAALVSLIDGVGLGIVLPHVPFYVLELGGAPALVAQLVAAYMLSSFLAAPAIGHLSDRLGVRGTLQVTLAGSLLSYLGMMFSANLFMLFAFRALGGAMSGREAILQALITAGGDQTKGAKHVGFVTAAALLGAAAGPLIAAIVGFYLDNPSLEIKVCLGIGLALTAAALAMASKILPDRPPNGALTPPPALGALTNLAMVRSLIGPIVARVGMNYGIGLALAVNAMFLYTQYEWRAENTAWLLGVTTLVGALGRAALAQPAIRRFGVGTTLFWMLAAASAGFLAMGFSHTALIYAFLFGGYLLAHNIALICNIMQTSAAASGPARGLAFGIVHSAGALALAFSASVNGVIFAVWGPRAPYLAAALALGLTALLLAAMSLRSQHRPQSAPL
jgi:predicted MFS family arabinose efflux permease